MKILGQTYSGKNVYVNETADFAGYKDFTSQEHTEASLLYNDRRIKYNLTFLAVDRSFEIEYSHRKKANELMDK